MSYLREWEIGDYEDGCVRIRSGPALRDGERVHVVEAATVQPDDAEAVTEAFLNETGFIYHGGEQSWLLDVIDVDGGEFCLEYYRDRVLVVGQVAFPAKTRGQVRRLIAALKGATP